MIDAGDKVVAVAAEHSTCPIHNLQAAGPDPCPEMVGKVFEVVDTAHWLKDEGCEGLIVLAGDPFLWCVGCFRKVDRADDEFIQSLKVKEPT